MKTSTKTLTAALTVLGLTIVHHRYGAKIYQAPFRRHVAAGIVPVLLVLVLAYGVQRRRPLTALGRASQRLFMILTLVVPVGLIGLFEGGYNHLVKNILYFAGASRALLQRLYPPPTYEMPNDFWFELTGILQFLAGLHAGYWLVRLWRETAKIGPSRPALQHATPENVTPVAEPEMGLR